MYQCDYCNYESIYKYNVIRHEEGKHGQQSNTNNQQIHPNSNQKDEKSDKVELFGRICWQNI